MREDIMFSASNHGLAEFWSEEKLLAVCPNAGKSEPTNPKVSKKYAQANSLTIVRDIAADGWGVVDAKQCRAKKGSSGIHSFHYIAFQNPNVKIDDECYPRIILMNSHDGFHSFKFMIGLFRVVCSNGLVIDDGKMVELSIRHINYTPEQLHELVAKAVENVTEQTKVMHAMKEIKLNQTQKEHLAMDAIRIRKGVKEDDKQFKINVSAIAELLSVNHDEDENDSLWSVYNTIQENAKMGNFSLKTRSGKIRKQREIKSFSRDVEFNRALFRSAYSYVQQAA